MTGREPQFAATPLPATPTQPDSQRPPTGPRRQHSAKSVRAGPGPSEASQPGHARTLY
jgi:hypothetical protein